MTMLLERKGAGAVLDRDLVRPSEPELEALHEIAEVITLVDRAEPTIRPALLGPNNERIQLPDSLYRILRQVVERLERGESVSIVHADEELTTQQAADLLNVSRPYLVRLIDRGEIACHRVGTHRRVRREDLEEYRINRDRRRRASLRSMVHDAEESGLYDVPEVPADAFRRSE